ncbi:hypothetical protein BC939DRAFT_480662 [Gamsiella multidivaricata]|uniref:uncharacterized protein n=1 Tax=Gamsiella multidivaricata TaxID=101098 RepID=UPI00221EDF78|nr:uncharacterized protein BC939DRAFT_480662 [Gamsiella multidivaricata]KAI7818104.1 hypothetical protein BC939DRAFT_480662 [Gamsiella multidivaricata]
MDTMEEEPEDASEAMTGVVVNADTGGFRSLSDEREKELIRQQVRQEWAKLVEEQTKEYEMMLQQAAAASAAKAQERELVRRNSWPRQLGQQQVQLKMPSQVLHPTMTSMDPLQQQVQMPFQPPAPGQQQDQHVASMMGPLSNPNAWSAAPLYALNTRRPSFTEYRG